MHRAGSSCDGTHDVCLALVTHPHDRARLHDAIPPTTDLLVVTAVAEVLATLRADRSRIRAVVLDPRDAAGRPTAGLARQITQLFPTVPVIGYCEADAAHAHDIVALASAGVHELLFKCDDSAAAVRAILATAQQTCAADLVLARLHHHLPDRLRPLVEHALAHPEESHTVTQVARAMGIHRRTLVARSTLEGAPPPGTIIAWCLLLLAAALLAPPGITVGSVAMRLNFPSAAALRNMLKRHTGLRPRDLRGERGIDQLIARFATLLDTPGSASALGR
jgi:AraC-like DNA-binding protein